MTTRDTHPTRPLGGMKVIEMLASGRRRTRA